jgi:hypothetical protein
MSRILVPLLTAVICALALTACGGGGGSASSTSPGQAPQADGSAGAKAAHPQAPSPAQVRAERRRAGVAAPFVVPGADNSVPTFGAQAGAAERDAAQASLDRYLRARARKEWPAACHLLATPTRNGFAKLARLGAKGCAPVLAALSKEADLGDPLIAGLLSLRVRGQNAFALFYGPDHQQYFVPLLREGETWRPTQPTPLEYPPAASG